MVNGSARPSEHVGVIRKIQRYPQFPVNGW